MRADMSLKAVITLAYCLLLKEAIWAFILVIVQA